LLRKILHLHPKSYPPFATNCIPLMLKHYP